MQLLHQQQGVFQLDAGARVEKTNAQGVGTHRASSGEHCGHLWCDIQYQLNHLPHIATVVLAQAGLRGNALDEQLHLGEQLFALGTLAAWRNLRLDGPHGIQQFITLRIELLNLLGVMTDRLQSAKLFNERLLKLGNPRIGLSRTALAEHTTDQGKVIDLFQIATNFKGAAQQLEAFQLRTGAHVLVIGVAHQVVVGDRHGQKK